MCHAASAQLDYRRDKGVGARTYAAEEIIVAPIWWNESAPLSSLDKKTLAGMLMAVLYYLCVYMYFQPCAHIKRESQQQRRGTPQSAAFYTYFHCCCLSLEKKRLLSLFFQRTRSLSPLNYFNYVHLGTGAELLRDLSDFNIFSYERTRNSKSERYNNVQKCAELACINATFSFRSIMKGKKCMFVIT